MSKQDEILIKAFLDAKAAEQAVLAKLDELLVEAREIRNSLNHAWSAYTKRNIPSDLGGSAPPEHTAPSYNEIKEADAFMASGAAPKPRVPPRRKKT